MYQCYLCNQWLRMLFVLNHGLHGWTQILNSKDLRTIGSADHEFM